MKTYVVEAKEKPLWYEVRWLISNRLMRLARWVYPESPDVKAFLMDAVLEQMMTGSMAIKTTWGKGEKEMNIRQELNEILITLATLVGASVGSPMYPQQKAKHTQYALTAIEKIVEREKVSWGDVCHQGGWNDHAELYAKDYILRSDHEKALAECRKRTVGECKNIFEKQRVWSVRLDEELDLLKTPPTTEQTNKEKEVEGNG